MRVGGYLIGVVLALAVAGNALAQQTPPDAALPPQPKEYNQQILVPGSWFHGVHGLAFNKDDQLFAGSVLGQTIYRVQVGRYADRREAEQVARKLEKDEQYKPIIHSVR